jgi:NAD(P)-dependent dehydrogenase (short-subunit alcohol dehydrogenase family)
VIVADYDKEGGNRVTEAIKGEGREAIFVEVDVSKPEQIEAMVDTTV